MKPAVDFSWTSEQQSLFNGAREFASGRLNGAGLDLRARWRLCGEAGFLGLCVATEYGGTGLDLLTSARVIEALGMSCRDTGLPFATAAHLFACALPIAEFAGEETKRRLLPGLCGGELIGANASSEPEAGSDILAMRARAVRDGGDYVLSGEKCYVTNATDADVLVVYAVTNAQHGYMGLSAFVVERGTAGLEVGRALAKPGLRAASLASVYLDGCRVPMGHRLGAEGQGAIVFASSMQAERSALFAAYLGMMERQLDEAVAYAKARRQFGRPIGKNQAVSHRLADMKLRLDASRLLLYRACWLVARSADPGLEVSLAKLAVSECAVQSSIDAIRVHGAAGVVGETGVGTALHDALPGTIFSGTSDIQRDIIAAKLGL
jgi:alkylation response protein AidB-like acyl-CoA dehydrogenase